MTGSPPPMQIPAPIRHRSRARVLQRMYQERVSRARLSRTRPRYAGDPEAPARTILGHTIRHHRGGTPVGTTVRHTCRHYGAADPSALRLAPRGHGGSRPVRTAARAPSAPRLAPRRYRGPRAVGTAARAPCGHRGCALPARHCGARSRRPTPVPGPRARRCGRRRTRRTPLSRAARSPLRSERCAPPRAPRRAGGSAAAGAGSSSGWRTRTVAPRPG